MMKHNLWRGDRRFINVGVPEFLIEVIDKHAETLNITRSSMIELMLVFFTRYGVVSKNGVRGV